MASPVRIAQTNVSSNHHAGTIRGLRFQFPPVAEAELIRCTRGPIMDVIVDLRPERPRIWNTCRVG